MRFQRIEPIEELKPFVECFWTVESADAEPVIQKIIPDGFPEIIFHYGDPYSIKLKDHWEEQSRELLAGQITGYFYLQNNGLSGILGIKLKPTAATWLFGISMRPLTDKVIPLMSFRSQKLEELARTLGTQDNYPDKIEKAQVLLMHLIPPAWKEDIVDKAIDSIFSSNGQVSVVELCERAATSERKLQRLFMRYVGLSPKFYARIIRFNYIFQLVQERKMSLSELGLESGFYDQSHFIRNFKAFTGEDPSRYFFEEPTLANFFLKK